MSRMERYTDIIPEHILLESNFLVIGVGAIGRQVAMILATMNAVALTIYDPDKVEEVNLGAQGYHEDQVGLYKVDALGETIEVVNSDVTVHPHRNKWTPDNEYYDVIFCCVDDMEARRDIFERHGQSSIFIDGRMAARSLQIYTCSPQLGFDHYKETLFPQEEAAEESCTSKTTFYCANVVAGLMVSTAMNHLVHGDALVSPRFGFNLLAMEEETPHFGDNDATKPATPDGSDDPTGEGEEGQISSGGDEPAEPDAAGHLDEEHPSGSGDTEAADSTSDELEPIGIDFGIHIDEEYESEQSGDNNTGVDQLPEGSPDDDGRTASGSSGAGISGQASSPPNNSSEAHSGREAEQGMARQEEQEEDESGQRSASTESNSSDADAAESDAESDESPEPVGAGA